MLFSTGHNQWRDSQTPRQILESYCESNSIAKPQYLGNTQLMLDGKTYNLQEFGWCSELPQFHLSSVVVSFSVLDNNVDVDVDVDDDDVMVVVVVVVVVVVMMMMMMMMMMMTTMTMMTMMIIYGGG